MRKIITLLCLGVIAIAIAGCGTSLKATIPTNNNAVTMNQVLHTVGAPPMTFSLTPTSVFGIDFGYHDISASTAKSLGAKFGASYISPDVDKNWLYSTVQAYHTDGLATVVVWESTATRAEDGYSAGVADAKSAKAMAADLGNTTQTIFFAVDCDCSGASILDYFEGVYSVLGSRTGAYGGYDQVLYLYDKKVVGDINWQTYAWSDGMWLSASIAPLEQYNVALSRPYDLDKAIATDYGQWPYTAPVVAKPTTSTTSASTKPAKKFETCFGKNKLNNSSCDKIRAHVASLTTTAKRLREYYVVRKCTVHQRKTNKHGCGSLYTRYRADQKQAHAIKEKHS